MEDREKKIADLIESMPDADKPGRQSKFTGPKWEEAERIIRGILKEGKPGLLHVIDRIHNPVSPALKHNYKADYVLHCIALYLSEDKRNEKRKEFCKTLASETGKESRPMEIRKILIRHLQIAGGREVVEDLAAYLNHKELDDPAAHALLAIGGDVEPYFRKAFLKAEKKNKVTLAQALGVLRDDESVGALLEASRDDREDVRIAATWAAANTGAEEAVKGVLKAAARSKGWERIQANKACLLVAERLLESGRKGAAKEIYRHLQRTRRDPAELHVSKAAKAALSEAGI